MYLDQIKQPPNKLKKIKGGALLKKIQNFWFEECG